MHSADEATSEAGTHCWALLFLQFGGVADHSCVQRIEEHSALSAQDSRYTRPSTFISMETKAGQAFRPSNRQFFSRRNNLPPPCSPLLRPPYGSTSKRSAVDLLYARLLPSLSLLFSTHTRRPNLFRRKRFQMSSMSFRITSESRADV